jgi:hypothetical protein
VAISNQRETFGLFGEHGEPVRPAIVWLDERAMDQMRQAIIPRMRSVSHHQRARSCKLNIEASGVTSRGLMLHRSNPPPTKPIERILLIRSIDDRQPFLRSTSPTRKARKRA